MPIAAQEAIHRPTIAIYRVDQNDEVIISETYASVLPSLERIDWSEFWRSKARFTEARQRLNETASLARGWDTYDAESPNIVARTRAAKILDVLETASLPPTRLTPTVEGGIAVSFLAGANRAVIEIYNSGEIAAATYSDEGEPTVWELDETEARLLSAINQIRVHLAA